MYRCVHFTIGGGCTIGEICTIIFPEIDEFATICDRLIQGEWRISPIFAYSLSSLLIEGQLISLSWLVEREIGKNGSISMFDIFTEFTVSRENDIINREFGFRFC
jgi:hypothetical protein